MENKQKELDSQIESIKQGNMVIHPTYGIGIVNNISDDKRKLYINFNNEMRCLSAPWVTEHCQIVMNFTFDVTELTEAILPSPTGVNYYESLPTKP